MGRLVDLPTPEMLEHCGAAELRVVGGVAGARLGWAGIGGSGVGLRGGAKRVTLLSEWGVATGFPASRRLHVTVGGGLGRGRRDGLSGGRLSSDAATVAPMPQPR
ncbi:hypothetical protein MFAL_13450 [Mycolicibacterium fallax]|nr:hypothetical protein MFAL_13450 [Mycolicibacterium fallax]